MDVRQSRENVAIIMNLIMMNISTIIITIFSPGSIEIAESDPMFVIRQQQPGSDPGPGFLFR